MKILIATGIYPPDIGGPAQYAQHIRDEFVRLGHTVSVVTYTGLERMLPFGLRHFVYFARIFFRMVAADFVVTLDTFSVAVPSITASAILGTQNVIRVGGDFLWESCVERTGDLITLPAFYAGLPALNLKERIIFGLMKRVLRNASALAFNSEWQKRMMVPVYGLGQSRTAVIQNFFGEPLPAEPASRKNFIWAARSITLKNGAMLQAAFARARERVPELSLDDAVVSHDELYKRLASCYAVILPSISEVSPNFILDALRFGKPFIMTKETGLHETLKDVGLFVDPLDEADITNKILWLSDAAHYEEQKKKIEAFHFTHTWEAIAAEILAFVDR